jgi:hypothetical protein
VQDDPQKTDSPDETPIEQPAPNEPLPTIWNASRQILDARVENGEAIDAADIKGVLLNPRLPEGDLLLRYAEQLLTHALAERDTEAARLLAGLMDDHPELDAHLYQILNRELHTEPDSVYAFLRAGLPEKPTERWLTRLQAAAFASLQVAITDGDTETVTNWLRLVAREPERYKLGEILHGALLAAGERAHNEGSLAVNVLTLAARRDGAALDTLLNDDKFMEAMPGNIGSVLRDFEGDALLVLRNQGAEMFVLAMVRAAQAHQPTLFTESAIEQIWVLLTGDQTLSLPAAYHLDRLVGEWTGYDLGWMDGDALRVLLTLMLNDGRDDLFLQLTRQMGNRDDMVTLLAGGFQHSELTGAQILSLTNQLINSAELAAQEAADLYVQLLSIRDWSPEDEAPVVQQLSRILYQHQGVTVNSSVLWHILEAAIAAKDEQMARVSLRRLTAHIESLEDDTILAAALVRLYNDTDWNPALHEFLLDWWRGFARACSLARLQRLDKGLDDKRTPEIRVIAQTVISLRKMQGKRTLPELAEAVSVTYGVMQAFADSFDPSAKRPMSFDQETVRAELDTRIEELSPHERKIFANNLKELAQLIGTLGDNRSKASLMRRGDDVDRQLMTGNLQPTSAVDALKWLAGYLSGTQDDDED